MEAAEAPVIRMGQTMAPIARLAISGGRSRRRGEGAAIGDGPSRGFGEKQNCLIACREVQFSFGEGITRSKGCERDKRGGGAKTHRDSPKVKPVSKTAPALEKVLHSHIWEIHTYTARRQGPTGRVTLDSRSPSQICR